MKKKHSKKVCLFTDTFCDANGVSRFIQDIAEIANNKKIDLNIITTTSKKYCKKIDNVTVFKPFFKIKMPFYNDLDLVFPPFFKFKKIIKEQKPDILHISTPGPIGISALILAKIYNIPKVGIYHTDFPAYIYENTKSKFLEKAAKLIMKYFYKNFSALFVRSKAYKEKVLQDINFPREKIHILKAGIDTKQFHKKYKNNTIWKQYNIDDDGIKILYVGRVSKEKNIPFLFDIWKEFYNKYSYLNSYLILAGNGEYEKEHDNLKKYGIHFLGHKSGIELSNIYASSNIFIFPSTTDTLGQVVMEAMSSGLPAIVTDQGGPKTIVNQNGTHNGVILSITNKNEWIKTLKTMAENEKLRELMGGNGFKTIQNMSIEKSFEHYWDIHEQISK